MTDRELLELAAKAAGLKEGIGGAFWTEDGGVFDPLTDDGDALRLAVKLGLRIYIYPGAGDDFTIAACNELTNRSSIQERHNGDPCAATRRAIVRAAAEIGKEMK